MLLKLATIHVSRVILEQVNMKAVYISPNTASVNSSFLHLSMDGADLISCALWETIPKAWGSHAERAVAVSLHLGRRHDQVSTSCIIM